MITAVYNIIVISPLLVGFGLYYKKVKPASSAASISQSLGTLLTFAGITWALYGFDTSDINASVPKMIEGMKLAFFSSVAGMFAAICIKMYDSGNATVKDSDITEVDEVHEEIIKSNQHLESIDAFATEASSREDDDKRAERYAKDVCEEIRQLGKSDEVMKELSKAIHVAIVSLNEQIDKKLTDTLGALSTTVHELAESSNSLREWQEKAENSFKSFSSTVDFASAEMKDNIEIASQCIDEMTEEMKSKMSEAGDNASEIMLGVVTNAEKQASEASVEMKDITTKMLNDIESDCEKQTEKTGKALVGMHIGVLEKVLNDESRGNIQKMYAKEANQALNDSEASHGI